MNNGGGLNVVKAEPLGQRRLGIVEIVLERAVVRMTSSIKSMAVLSASKMWARSLAFLRSNAVLRVTTSRWKSMACSISFKVMIQAALSRAEVAPKVT